MIPFRVEQCELTYEGSFVRPAIWLIDVPGRLCDLLLDVLQSFDCTSADLILEDGDPAEKGATCNIDQLDASLTIYGDRVQIRCADFASAAAEELGTVLDRLWPRLKALSAAIEPKTHSFFFEADGEIEGISYGELLNRFVKSPEALPTGVQTAAVFYLPAEPEKGYEESSFVLNRSPEIEGGLQVSATLVYGTAVLGCRAAVAGAGQRLTALLREFGLKWTEA